MAAEATYLCDTIKPQMVALRAAVDKAEGVSSMNVGVRWSDMRICRCVGVDVWGWGLKSSTSRQIEDSLPGISTRFPRKFCLHWSFMLLFPIC